MKLTAVAEDAEGNRFESTLTIPDKFQAVLDVNEAEKRLRFALQREVNRAVEILSVSLKDDQDRVEREKAQRKAGVDPKKRAADAGPDQVAFAGTKESVEVPETGTKARGKRER